MLRKEKKQGEAGKLMLQNDLVFDSKIFIRRGFRQ